MILQSYNPYLPLNEYIPDGEPRLFGSRVYIYGSHDRAYGTNFCEDNYNVWSAPADNLKEWRDEGTVYYRDQDPSNAGGGMQLWAPDVVQGPDGRYYMYYCLCYYPEIGVAVSESPAGPFQFYGHVHYNKNIFGGKTLTEDKPFDPAVLVDDDGRVYLYYGFAPACESEMKLPDINEMDFSMIPDDLKEKIGGVGNIELGEYAMAAELEPDMLTLKEKPKPLIPGGHHTEGTGFEGHGFFEASSIRKIQGKYYFVYSSHKSHELCYAVSDSPMKGFIYGGTIISNGDVGLEGRTKPVNILGNNHGGILVNGSQYYIFYHRQTNGTQFSRQGCAEPIEILPDGTIPQVPVTSCGLNGGPLKAKGVYPAAIACHLTDASTLDHLDYENPVMHSMMRITQEGYSQIITDVKDKACFGYKYFLFGEKTLKFGIELYGEGTGIFYISLDEEGKDRVGGVEVSGIYESWHIAAVTIRTPEGCSPLYVHYKGTGNWKVKNILFI